MEQLIMELEIQLTIEIINLQERLRLTKMDFMAEIYKGLIEGKMNELKMLSYVEWV